MPPPVTRTPEEQRTHDTRVRSAQIELLANGLRSRREALIGAGALPPIPTGGAEPNWTALATGLVDNPPKWNGTNLDQSPAVLQSRLRPEIDRSRRMANHIVEAGEEHERTGPSIREIGAAFIGNPLGFLGSLLNGIFEGFKALANGTPGGFMGAFHHAFEPVMAHTMGGVVAADAANRINADRNIPRLQQGEMAQLVQHVGAHVEHEMRGQPVQLTPTQQRVQQTREQTQRTQQVTANRTELHNAIHGQVLQSLGLRQNGNTIERDPRNPAEPGLSAADKKSLEDGRAAFVNLQFATGGQQFALNTPQGQANLRQLTDTLTNAMETVATDAANGRPRTPEEVRDFIESRLQENAPNMGFSQNGEDIRRANIVRLISNNAATGFLQARAVDQNDRTRTFIDAATRENDELQREIAGPMGAALSGAASWVQSFRLPSPGQSTTPPPPPSRDTGVGGR